MNPATQSPTFPEAGLPSLRPWQAQCIEQALQTLSPTSTQVHFLCQATPGAGKMLMAASLTNSLLQRGDINYVIYLAPTRALVKQATETLSQITGMAMDGKLGASGAAYTYHALQHRLDELKRLGKKGRVLLIWDESHHAAGYDGTLEGANQWGFALMALERHVRYTLALSGTPWRTDGSFLPLLRYVEVADENSAGDQGDGQRAQRQLQPDYVYTLREAIRDGICRFPHIELVDNRSIELKGRHPRTGRQENRHYSSIPHLLRHPAVHYSSLIRDDAPMERMLTLGCERLGAVRKRIPSAAGLVVASDIVHAEEIAQRLEDLGQGVCLVTSRETNAHARLDAFREADTPWIVSVGMVSEGVDIPRLQVCCYLSHIRTEQSFRQVLGRIIRRTGQDDGECYCYALNEVHLRRFARRLNDDLPEDLATVALSPARPGPAGGHTAAPDAPASFSPPEHGPTESDPTPSDPSATPYSVSMGATPNNVSVDPDVAYSEAFFERLVALRLVT
ncbi:DEAD/DEAH box helicase [Halomonas sp. HK25]|uniref:DEAD/DEAH box helicase n=1 Tax=Halomonas sp. HK25 TaxID=3394321 RepID=UPI0039FC19B5